MFDENDPDIREIAEMEAPDGIRILSRLAVGKRSLWFKAEQTRLNRTIALKYLRPSLAQNEATTEAFFEAGRQAAAIVHPAAMPIINVFRKQRCIAMHLCPGQSLKELHGALPPAAVASIGAAVMDCLSTIHATNRRHGNLSPGNIFLDEDAGIWVNDFFHPPVIPDGGRRQANDLLFVAPEAGCAAGGGGWTEDAFSLGRVLSYALSAEPRNATLDILLSAMQSDNPDRRGGAPEHIAKTFLRVRKEEETRIGLNIVGQAKRGERRYRRVPAEFDVSLRQRSATPTETASILMKIRDIGESGVFVETNDDSLQVGSILELDFALKGTGGNVHAFGVVRWLSRPPMPRGVGVQFVEIEQKGLMQLREYIAKSR